MAALNNITIIYIWFLIKILNKTGIKRFIFTKNKHEIKFDSDKDWMYKNSDEKKN